MTLPDAAAGAVPASYARHLCKLLARWDVATDALLGEVGIDPAALTDPQARLSFDMWRRLLVRAREQSGEPALGIHVGLHLRVSAHGYLGLGALAAPTLGDAIRLWIEYGALSGMPFTLRGHVESGAASLVLEECFDFGEVRDVVLFAVAAGMWQAGSAVMGRPLRLTFDMPFARPAYFDRFSHLLPPTRFDTAVCMLTGPASGLSSPPTLADEAAYRLMRDECDRLFVAMRRVPDIASSVRNALPCAKGFQSIDEVAKQLGVSSRTLRRKLADEGQSFARLLNEERQRRARVLLRSTTRSIDEIADMLGYADASSLSRAFTTWTGKSPAEYRRDPG